MSISKHKQARTLWIGNLPHWADEKYLCLCFYFFNSVPTSYPGTHVKIIRNKKTGCSNCYGFMTFETRETAERILHLYNGLKIMPGTTKRFCMNWALYRSAERTSGIKRIRSKNSSSFWRVKTKLENNKEQVPESSNLSLYTTTDLPLDVIENILSWLPAKSIGRCRMTCSAWASLTSTPRFIDRHLQNQKDLNDSIVAIGSTDGQCTTYVFSNCSMDTFCSFSTVEFKFNFGFSRSISNSMFYQISNACNGLVCIYRRDYNNTFASVVNPLIQETIQLPKSPNILRRPTYDIRSIGLGYDECSDTYKIVRMVKIYDIMDYSREGVEYEVITLGDANCQWRHLGYIPYNVQSNNPPVFLHDSIYWIMSETYPQQMKYVVVSINVRTEIVRVFCVPEVGYYYKLFVLEDCLCILSKHDPSTRKTNLHVLEDNLNFKWVKKHTIKDNLRICSLSNPIAIHDGKILFTHIFHHPFSCHCLNCTTDTHRSANYYYDTKNGRFEKTTAAPQSSRRYIESHAIRGCAESLISPISYLQRSSDPCPVFHFFGQKWATLFPTNPSSELSE